MNETKASQPRKSTREQPSTISYSSLQALRIKLGQILIDAGLLAPEPLQEALKIAKESQEPIGRILLMLNYITEHALQSALLAQSLISEGVVDQPAAVEALRRCVSENVPLQEALEQTESARAISDSSELDEIMVEANLITAEVYQAAKKASRENKIPLGRALVLNNSITFKALNNALECVALMRQGRLNKPDAVAVLSQVRTGNVEFHDALKKAHVSPRTTLSKLKLGDILTAGRFINERENLAAVERALLEKRLLGDVLVESGLVSKDLVQIALTLQNLAVRGVINQAEAVKALRKVIDEKKAFADVAEEMGLFRDDPATADKILDLLFKSGLARPDDVPIAQNQQTGFRMDALKALVASGCVSDLSYQAAIDAYSMLIASDLTFDQAIIALQACDRNRSSLLETLDDMGSKINHPVVVKPEAVGKNAAAEPQPELLVEAPWASFMEAKLLIANGILAAITLWVLYQYGPAEVKYPAIAAVLLIVSVIQIVLHKSFQSSVAERKRQKQEKLEVAQLNMRSTKSK